ncbi:MAG: ACT domain-containing protein [Planctomycetes bacterium]|nr:ACT domain-containing protein [Planctomycetota bacterium]
MTGPGAPPPSRPPTTPPSLFLRTAVREGGRAVREALGAAREAVLAERAEAGGLATARGLAACADAVVRAFVDHRAPSGRGFTVLALGGYGRGELCPFSDLDLLVLARRRTPAVRDLAADLAALLWDAGASVHLTLRTPGGTAAAMAKDHAFASSVLDHRFLAGDRTAAEVLRTRVLRPFLKRHGERFVALKRAEAIRRRAARGGTAALLEPDVKESPGGLRDVHAAGWLSVLSPAPPDGRALERALDAILRFRIEMHLLAGRKQDLLDLGTQRDLVPRLLPEGADLPPEERHLRALAPWFAAARDASRACERALGEEPTDGDPLPGDAAGLRALLEARAPAGPALRALHRRDRLERLLPEWGAVVALPQADPYHAFTVDEHTLRGLEALDGWIEGRGHGWKRLAEEAAALPSLLPLRLGLLLHDVGKVRGSRGHAARGAEEARGAPERLGLPPADAGAVIRLVEHHTVLGEASALSVHGDEEAVRRVAAAAGTREGLRLLLLCTAADIAGVGNGAWTAWRAAQLLEFHDRVEAVLRGAPAFPPDLGGALREVLPPRRAAEIDSLLARAPHHYAASVPPRRARLHLDLLRRRRRRGGAVAGLEERPGAVDLSLAAGDRPHLFADLAGALTLAGCDILSADAHTLSDGTALDDFTVRAPIPGRARVLGALEEAALAPPGSAVPALRAFARRLRAGVRPPGDRSVLARRTDDGSGPAAEVRVECPDRPGLLHDLARVLSDAGCDLRQVRVATLGPRALDAFRISRGGRPPAPGEETGALLEALREAAVHPPGEGW